MYVRLSTSEIREQDKGKIIPSCQTAPGSLNRENTVPTIPYMDPVFSHSSWGEGAGAHYSPGGFSHALPIQVCAAQRGCDFEARDLDQVILSEAFSRAGNNILNA